MADVAYRDETVDAGVTFTYADSSLNGNAAAPIELLDVDRSAVFTYPDITENRLAFVQGRFDVAVSPTWSVQVTGYYRDLDRKTLNGDEAEFEECDDDFLPPGAPLGTLCFGADDDDDDDEEHEGDHNGDDDGDDDDDDNGASAFHPADDDDDDHDGDDDDEEEAHPLVDVNSGRFITEDDTEGNAAYNRTTTRSKGFGGHPAGHRGRPPYDSGRENVFSVGVSADLADVGFTSSSEVGTLTSDRTVTGSGLLAGLYGQAPDDLFNTGLDTANSAIGAVLHRHLLGNAADPTRPSRGASTTPASRSPTAWARRWTASTASRASTSAPAPCISSATPCPSSAATRNRTGRRPRRS